MIEVRDGRTSEWFVEPGDVGLAVASLDDVAGGSPAGNAHVARAVLAGERGPARDLALLNAGAAIFVAGGSDDLASGVAKAGEAVDSGAAEGVLGKLRDADR